MGLTSLSWRRRRGRRTRVGTHEGRGRDGDRGQASPPGSGQQPPRCGRRPRWRPC